MIDPRAIRRLSQTMQKQATPAQRVSYLDGAVDHIDAGAGLDGNDVVYVTIAGGTIPITWHAGQTLTAGDVVTVLIRDSSPLILGKPVGFPDL